MRLTKKILSLVLVAAMVASFAAMTGFQASAASAVGRTQTNFNDMYFNDSGKFRILQLADIQTTANKSSIAQITKDTIRLGIERYTPDLIILTGDQTQGGATESQWKSACDKVLATITDAGFPLSKVAVTMGNHDPQADGISLENQQAYYVSKGCIDFDNNFSSIDLAGGGTGCIPIRASSTDSSVAFNVTLFDSGGNGDGGYQCIGSDHAINGPNYTNIVNWYTNMNNTIAESSYKKAHNLASGTNSAGYKNYLVPTLCAQHIILQEVFTTGGLEACASGTAGSVGANDTYNPNGAAAYKLSSSRAVTGKLGETPCCTGSHSSTANQYHAVADPGNCVGFAFGHDHDNSFAFTDDNGLQFLATSGLSKEVYLTDGNPGLRYFDLTLDTTTGNVNMQSANKKYTDLTQGASVSLNSGRVEFLDDSGNQIANTLSVPQVIYVGDGNNSISQQLFGSVIQTELLNYEAKTMYPQDLDVRVVIPAGATNWDLSIKCNGNTISWYNSAWGSDPNGSYYVCTMNAGGTGTAGQPVTYELTYDLDGRRMLVTAASSCENIKMPGGYAVWQRNYAGNNKDKTEGWIELNYVGVLTGTNVFSTGEGYWVGGDTWYNSSGYFDYSNTGELDTGYKPMGNNKYTMWWYSEGRARDDDLVGLTKKGIGADAAPRSIVYVDKDSSPVVATNDQRRLLGAKLSIWNAHDSDNGWEAYLAGLGFYSGFIGNTPTDYLAAMKAEMATCTGANGESTGSFAYDSYASAQSLSGVSSTHVNGNTLAANKVGANQGDSLLVPLTTADANTFPADGLTVTMLAGMRVKGNSNNYAVMVYSLDPYGLQFVVYDKAQMRLLINQEATEARQRADYPEGATVDTAWTNYTNKLKAAQILYARIDTTQGAIDTAVTQLNEAIITLMNSRTVSDPSLVEAWQAEKPANIKVPHILYVNGTTIQTAAPFTARNISFVVPAGTTSATCTVITGDNNDSVNSAVSVSGSLSGTTWNGTVTGGTATAGGAVNYKLSYVKDGVTYIQYAASYVRTIPMKTTRWYFFVNDTHGAYSDCRIQHEDILDITNNFSFEGASAIASIYPTQGGSFDSNVINGTGTSSASSGAGYSLNGADKYSSAGTATIFNDRSGSGNEDWIGTLAGSTNSGNTVTEYVVANYYYDKTTVTTSAQLNATITQHAIGSETNINGSAYAMLDDQNYTTYAWGREPSKSSPTDGMSPRFEVVGTNNLNANMGTNNTLVTNIRVKAGALPMTTSSTVMCFRKFTDEKRGVWSYLAFAFAFNPVDRINAHNAVDAAIQKNFVKEKMTTAWWNSYRAAMLQAYKHIGDLWGSWSGASQDHTPIMNLINNPKYVPADYTPLFNAVNACTNANLSASKHCITNADYTSILYKVPAGDDARYVGMSFGPTMFMNNATDLITILRNRSTVYSQDPSMSEAQNNMGSYLLDFTYQTAINNYAATITAAAAQIRLKAADYTNINRYTDYYDAANHTIFFETSNNAGYNNAAEDRAYANGEAGMAWSEYVFTATSANALSGACAGIDRTLKKPSETQALTATNGAGAIPRLYPAAYTYKYGVTTPDNTACTYNTLRNAYEDLKFRVANEYYGGTTGSAEYPVDGVWKDPATNVTYYANYDRTVNKVGGAYVYTAAMTIDPNATATIVKGGLKVALESARDANGLYGPNKTASDNTFESPKAAYEEDDGNNVTYNVLNGDGSVAGTVTKYTAASWGGQASAPYNDGFIEAYNRTFNAVTSNLAAGYGTTSQRKLALYVQRDIMPLLADGDFKTNSLIKERANTTALASQLGIKATYEEGGELSVQYGLVSKFAGKIFDAADTARTNPLDSKGSAWYTTATWNDYASAKTAATTSSQDTTLTSMDQTTINNQTVALYQKRAALETRKIQEYNSTYADVSGNKDYASINSWFSAANSKINNERDCYTIDGSGNLIKTTKRNDYNSTFISQWNTLYTTLTNITNNPTADLGATIVAYTNCFTPLINKDADSVNNKLVANYDPLLSMLNGANGMRAPYDIGGTSYTTGMGTAIGFNETPITVGGTTYNTTGATWYSASTWSEYEAKRKDAVNAILATATSTPTSNQFSYGTTYSAGTVATDAIQAQLNTALEAFYNARKNLVPRKLSEYSVSTAGAWYDKTNYADINAQAGTYKTEIANQKGNVTTVTATPSKTPPYSPNTVDLGTTTRQFYSTAFIGDMNSAYVALNTFNTTNANADLAKVYEGYRGQLNSFKTLYESKTNTANLNTADYSYLTALLGRTWIPKYDTYGAFNYNGTNYIIGSQFSGSDWYSAQTWNAYNTARNAAANATSAAANYNGGTGYGNLYGAGSSKMNGQDAINTLVTNLSKAYYSLQYKTVSEFSGTWEGATGYADISTKVSAMTNGFDATVPVWSNFAGKGSGITYTTTQAPLYDSEALATIMAQRNALLGTLTATTAGVNASTNIQGTDVLAEKYNAYLNQLAAYKTALDNCQKNNANYVELVKQIGTWADYDGYWVSGTSVVGGSSYTYALSRESGLAGTSNGATWYTAASWTPYNTARNAATNITAQAANFNYGSSYTAGNGKLTIQDNINNVAKNLYAARQELVLRPLSEYNVSWTATQNSTAYANYAAMKTFVNTADNFSWVNGKVTVIESFTGTTANTSTKGCYTAAAVSAVEAAKAAAATYCDDTHNLVECIEFKNALNGINTAYTNNYGKSYNDVYQTGWNWIFAQLTAKAGTVGTINETTLSTYLTKMCNVDLSTVSTSGGVAITTTLADKATFITGAPKATTASQDEMNTYVTNLYNELINTTAVSTQVASATAAAQAKIEGTVNAYDPMQLNGRTKVTKLTKYTSESIAALNNVISSVGTYTLWTATPAALGYNETGKIIDGTEATKIWKAAGLTSAVGTTYAENKTTNPAFVLTLASIFLDSLNDAVSYAKTELYADPTAATLVQKTTVAHAPSGATYSYNTFTTASANELIAALAAVNTSGLSISDQATVDQWVHDIIEQTDIANSVKIEDADGGLYGTLADVAGDNGLKYNAAYYNYLSTEITTISSSTVSSLIWDAANNNALIMENGTAKGAYYYTTQTWNAYAAALANAKADSGKLANQQAAIDALAESLYNARNSLAFKTLDQSVNYSAAEALVSRAEGIYNLELTKVTYTNNTTSSTRNEVTGTAYPDSAVEALQDNMTAFIAAYITNATTTSITNEAAMNALITQYNAEMDAMSKKNLSVDGEFAAGVQSLVDSFVAGAYTRSGSSSTFTSENLPAAMKTAIKTKLDAIYTFLASGSEVSAIHNDDVTNMEYLTSLTDDLYEYCTGTRAKNATFAVTAQSNLYDFLSQTVPSAIGDIYANEVPVFDEDHVAEVCDSVDSLFSSSANWPCIYQLDDSVFDLEDYTYDTDDGTYSCTTAGKVNVSTIAELLNQVGGMSTNYRETVSQYTNSYMTDALGWFNDNAVITDDNTGKTYVLAIPDGSLLGDLDGTLGYDVVNSGAAWYTDGYGITGDDGASQYYVFASDTPNTGNPDGGWFTIDSSIAVSESKDALITTMEEMLNSSNPYRAPKFGRGTESSAARMAIINNGWTETNGQNYMDAILSEQSTLDEAVNTYYTNICMLELLPATDAYREVLALIYAANAQDPTFADDSTDLEPIDISDVDIGGRIFNNELLGVLGSGNYTQVDGIYYSTQLPTAYKQDGDNSISGIFDYFNGLELLTIDKAIDVNGDGDGTVKEDIINKLRALTIGLANFEKVIELATAFLNNNAELTTTGTGLGIYDSSEGAGRTFFQKHTGLAAAGNALSYKNDTTMQTSGAYNPSGFYTYDNYTQVSLASVVDFMKQNGIITGSTTVTVFNTTFSNAIKGSMFSLPLTQQSTVDDIYTRFVAAINGLELKKADMVELAPQITKADEIVIDESYYDTEDPTWDDFLTAKAEADALKDTNIINQELVTAAQENLTAAIEALVVYVDSVPPVLTVHNELSDIKSFCADHPELGISQSDAVTGTYIQPNLGGYTMYIYTNKLNPKFVITLQDSTAYNGKTVKTSKPEKMAIQGLAAGGASAKVITPVLNEAGLIANATTSTLTSSTSVLSETPKTSSGKYDADANAYMVLSPVFSATGSKQQAVKYVIDGSDSAQDKKTGEELNNEATSFNFNGSTTDIENTATTNGKITVMVYYMNSMPADGFDEGYDAETGKVTGPAVLEEHEYSNIAKTSWIGVSRIYRTFDPAVKSHEFVSAIDTATSDVPVYNDPNFGTSNIGSFLYVIDPAAKSGSFDYYIAKEFYASGASAAKTKAIELLNNSTYMNSFKSTSMKTDRYRLFGANDYWWQSTADLQNGTLVYAHVIDRWGNVCNRVIEIDNTDLTKPEVTSASDGAVTVNEKGGAGIGNMDIFTYMGTSGSSLYSDYHLSQYELSGQNTWVSEDNTFRISGLTPGILYTIAARDKALNTASCNVKADANGEIKITVAEEYEKFFYNTDNAPVGTNAVDGEDKAIIEFILNGADNIMLNFGSLSSIVKAGPDGNVLANNGKTPLNITTTADVTSIKVTDKDSGTETTWTSGNATLTTNTDGTVTWTVKQSFTEGKHSYSAVAMVNGEWELFPVDFDFVATTKTVLLKFITIGQGKTVMTWNDGNRTTFSSLTQKTVPYGSVVKLVSTPIVDGVEFVYWKNNQTERVISTANVMEFTAVTDMELTPQFTTAEICPDGKKLAIYTTEAGNVINSYEIPQGGNYTVPAGPALPDHVFKNWSMSKEEVLASDELCLIIKPVYSLVISNTVEITEGNYTTSGAGKYSSTDNERAIVNISASATDNNGAAFSYWLDAETGDIVSYSRTYSFFCIKDTVLTPVYSDGSATVAVPVVRISTVKYDDTSKKVNFYAERSVPDGYEVYQTGVIVTKTGAVGESESEFVIGAAGVGKGTSTSTSSNGFYTGVVSATSGSIVYARAYIIYRDAADEIVTTYSPITSYTVK